MFREGLTSGFCRVQSEKNQSSIGLGFPNGPQILQLGSSRNAVAGALTGNDLVILRFLLGKVVRDQDPRGVLVYDDPPTSGSWT